MSIIKHVTLQKIVAHDFRYVPRTSHTDKITQGVDKMQNFRSHTNLAVHVGNHLTSLRVKKKVR